MRCSSRPGYTTARDQFAVVAIERNDPLSVAEIDDTMAAADGFPDAAALRTAVLDLYGDVPLRLVRFQVVRALASHRLVGALQLSTEQ